MLNLTASVYKDFVQEVLEKRNFMYEWHGTIEVGFDNLDKEGYLMAFVSIIGDEVHIDNVSAYLEDSPVETDFDTDLAIVKISKECW